ncbi:hypothetical protein [Winogradskyella rapida]|uniref:Lipoprotein n=1 Tax=Winogradskyella rapida TaxID=549701 RepID=A0ABW3KRA2_9FLAO
MKHPLRLLALLFIFLFNSCGYQQTEEDKYPEIPVFPEHTNSKISITEFPYTLTNIKYNQNHVFANDENGNWIILDRKFNVIKQLHKPSGYTPSYMSNDGTLYTIKPHDQPELNEVYQRSMQNDFKKELVKPLILKIRGRANIKDSLQSVYTHKTKAHIDSLTAVIYKKEEKNLTESLKALHTNLVSIFPLTPEVSVLKYKNKTVALCTSYDHSDAFKAFLEQTQLKALKPIWHLEKSPKSFGKVVLGNSFSGNHYVGGYTPYGYNYVELSLHDKTTRFKAKNANNGNGVHILYESKDTIIVKEVQKLYHITLNPNSKSL